MSLMILWHQFQCLGFFGPTPSNSPTAAECPMIQVWHYLPGDGVTPHMSQKTAPSIQMTFTGPECHLSFWSKDYKLGYHDLPWIWLFCQSHSQNSRKIFYLLYYWLIIKGCNSATARWKRCIGRGMRKRDIKLPAFWISHRLQTSMYSPTQKPAAPCLLGFWRLCYTGVFD